MIKLTKVVIVLFLNVGNVKLLLGILEAVKLMKHNPKWHHICNQINQRFLTLKMANLVISQAHYTKE